MNTNPPIGSNFDDFLAEEGILAEVEAVAIKRVLTFDSRNYIVTAYQKEIG